MAEAEYLLPYRQRKAEGVLSPSVNGEERVSSPLPPEKALSPPPFTADSHSAHNGYEPRSVKTPAALHSRKSQPCKKKKKCLSDIFGHIIGGSKETSLITKVADQFPTTTCALKEESQDSPYADLESVPMLHRPKRAAVSPVQAAGRPGRREDGSPRVEAEFTEKQNHSSSGSSFSPGCLANSLQPTDPEQSVSSSDEIASRSSKKHLVTFPASSGLMTRALKAEEDTDLKDAQICTDGRARLSPHTPVDVSTKTDTFLSWESPSTVPSFTTHSSPKRRARKPDKKQIRNGSLAAPKPAGSSGVPQQPFEIKAENVPQPVSSSSPSSSSPADALQDVKELLFKSLVQEEGSSSGLSVFRPDANYKFSTFLMLLKDMHDTREKEGNPLTLPPLPVLIKEEPLVIPSAAADLGSVNGLTQTGIKVETEQAETAAVQNSTVKPKKRTKPIMSSESYHFQDFPTNSQIEKSDKQHTKWRLPAKVKPIIPGLSSDLANLAYGREYVTGHADLAGPASCPLGASNSSANYLDKNCGTSTVAPKKRWQMVEEDESQSEVVERRVSFEMNGSFRTASPNLNLEVEKQGNSDLLISETNFSTAGKKKNPCCLMDNLRVISLSVAG